MLLQGQVPMPDVLSGPVGTTILVIIGTALLIFCLVYFDEWDHVKRWHDADDRCEVQGEGCPYGK